MMQEENLMLPQKERSQEKPKEKLKTPNMLETLNKEPLKSESSDKLNKS